MDDHSDPAPNRVRSHLSIVRSFRWQTLVRDAILVAAWVGIVSLGWGLLQWPTWAYYLVVFSGITVYSLSSEPWGESDDVRR